MPPAMSDLLDIWAAHSPLAGHALDQITVDFLLPTGIYIQMDVPREATVQHIKLMAAIALCLALGLEEHWKTPPVETIVDDFDRVKYQPKPSLT